jgi:hypothetical protein
MVTQTLRQLLETILQRHQHGIFALNRWIVKPIVDCELNLLGVTKVWSQDI